MPRVKLFGDINIGGGGVAAASNFSDTFNRANDPNGLGGNWLLDAFTPTEQAATVELFTNTIRLTNTAVTGFNTGIRIIPRITAVTLFGQSQFSQATLFSDDGAGASVNRGGVGVMLFDDNGYLFELAIEVPIFALVQANFPTMTPLTANFGVPAVGDVLRIDVLAEAAQNTIRCFQNGTLIKTVVDNSAGRPVFQGSPGLMYVGSSAGKTQRWSAYSNGPR